MQGYIAMKKKILIVLSAFMGLSYANCSLINQDVTNFMQKNQVNGVAIALINNNHTEYCNYGYADKAKHKKITQNTIFEIASLTKTFTAALAAIAQTQGKYDLSRPITAYIKGLTNPYYQQINGIELLTHTSNIPMKLPATATEPKLIASLNSMSYTNKPQTIYVYSNPGIALVGNALQHIYGQDYQSILQTELLNKLGITNTFMTVPEKYQNMLSQGFNQNNQVVKSKDFGALDSAAGLKSNAHDLALYINYQINGSNDNTLNKALSIVHKDYYCINDERYQQLVWEHSPQKDLDSKFKDKETLQQQTVTTGCRFEGGLVSKTGTLLGMSSYIAYSPENKTGVVILLNKGLVGDRVRLADIILKAIGKHNN